MFDETCPSIKHGDAQDLPLECESIDLIITSPPYASNAIDYMRAHKFSLVWLNFEIDELTQKRKEYIGGDSLTGINFEELPQKTQEAVMLMSQKDKRKGRVLHRYYSEITCVLQEMFRVLKSGKAAIVVVGNSVWGGQSTETHTCIADIGRINWVQCCKNRHKGNWTEIDECFPRESRQTQIPRFKSECTRIILLVFTNLEANLLPRLYPHFEYSSLRQFQISVAEAGIPLPLESDVSCSVVFLSKKMVKFDSNNSG